MKKGNAVYKRGFNLLDTYPVSFCNVIRDIPSEGTPETFTFSLPDKKVEQLVISLYPTEPWALPNWVILKHNIPDFFNKLKELRNRYFPSAHCSIAIDEKDTKAIDEIREVTYTEEWMRVFPMRAIYPGDNPVLLVKRVSGVDIPFGEDPLTKGILLLDAQTTLALYEQHILGNTITSRFITLSGTGLKENEIVHIRLGTSFKYLLHDRTKEGVKYRIFVNGPLHGKEITDLSQGVDWAVNNVVVLKEQDYKVPFPMIKPDELIFTTNIQGAPRRCIYCNFCDDICPVDLEPALYYHAYIKGEKQKARLYNMGECIECGLCSFICPSKLELLQIIKECKALK